MTDLQERMLLLLKEIDEICRKHDITYFLFAGTALGAARHKGFIPWDDDTDIIMDLENYEKFLSVIHEELKEGRALDWVSEDSEYLFTTPDTLIPPPRLCSATRCSEAARRA